MKNVDVGFDESGSKRLNHLVEDSESMRDSESIKVQGE